MIDYTEVERREPMNKAMEQITAFSPEEILAMLAFIHAITGRCDVPVPKGYSRGDFKRSIRKLRMVQRKCQELTPDIESAVALIRREWLHRPVNIHMMSDEREDVSRKRRAAMA